MNLKGYNSKSKIITVTMSEKDLSVLYAGLVRVFCDSMNEHSPLWKETDKIISELSFIANNYSKGDKNAK